MMLAGAGLGSSFGRRQVYFYYAVPLWQFEDFLKADSKGRYLTQVFLPKGYPYTGPYPSRTQAA